MTIPLKQKLEQLLARYQHDTTMPPADILEVCEALRSLLDGQEMRLAAIMEAQIHVNARLHAVERIASTYDPPRGT